GDRGDVDGQVEGLFAVAHLGGGGQLLLVQGGVGAGELHLAGEELLAPGAGAGGVVGDGHIPALGLDQAAEGLGPRRLRVLHGGGAGAGEVPAELGVAAGRCGALRTARAGAGVLGAAAAGGQRETADESERGERDELVLANVHCESFRGPWAREAVQREGLTAGTLRSADDGPPARA